MRVYLSTDHGGFEMKETLKRHLTGLGVEAVDCGAFVFDKEDDYPDFILPMVARVVADPGSLGIVLGRSGNGEAIAANKVRGARCALATCQEMARKGREHNDANVLALGGDYIDMDEALKIVEIFIRTPFSGEARHARRVEKIARYESAQGPSLPG
jgi:ribose 5-phosphate isomerase B